MNYLTLNSTQARQAHEGERFQTWERMEPQPPADWEPHPDYPEPGWFYDLGGNPVRFGVFANDTGEIFSRYAPGDVVAVKEPWQCGGAETYRQSEIADEHQGDWVGLWLPAEQMPDDWFHVQVRCLSIRAERQNNEWGWAVEWEKANGTD